MTRDFLMATIAALGLTACGPDLSTDSQPPANAGAPRAQAGGAPGPSTNEAAVARAEQQPGADDSKEDERKEDAEQKPQ
jgi:hypothetical protein